MQNTNDIRIKSATPLVSPAELKKQYPADDAIYNVVSQGRREIEDILTGKDDRLLVITGPCSIHDPEAALEYAERLMKLREKYDDKICIVMRVYFEKPRTVVGWRGMIIDPHMDGSKDIGAGLAEGRKLLLAINKMGMPAGSELLDPTIPQYISDLISWAAIGARTTESQTHREMASGLSMPIGFKNGTDGSFDVAINAIASSEHPHSFLGIDQNGATVILNTTGHDMTHLILRGGKHGPNYSAAELNEAEAMLSKSGLPVRMLIDCSHANSGKKHTNQNVVFKAVIKEMAAGRKSIKGMMLESNIQAGRQDFICDAELGCVDPVTKEQLKYGVSVTDACIDFAETEELLELAYTSL